MNPSSLSGSTYRGQHVEGQWVFGGVERKTEKCFMIFVKKRNTATLLPIIIKEWILPGSIIMSDWLKAYEGYVHQKVNYSENFC